MREIIVKEWHDDKGLIHRREIGQELIRCRECKYWWKENELCAEEHHVVEDVCGVDARADDFCSYGERGDAE